MGKPARIDMDVFNIPQAKAKPVLEGRRAKQVCKVAQRWSAARVPERFKDARLDGFVIDNPERKKAAKVVDSWIDSSRRGRWLFLGGGVGVGKSYLAHALLYRCAEAGFSCLSVDWMSLCVELKSRTNYGMNAEKTIRDIQSVDVLLIDDFMKTRNQWDLELAFSVLNRRYNALKSVLITANHSLKEIAARDDPGSAIADRINEMGPAQNMGKQSRRRSDAPWIHQQ